MLAHKRTEAVEDGIFERISIRPNLVIARTGPGVLAGSFYDVKMVELNRNIGRISLFETEHVPLYQRAFSDIMGAMGIRGSVSFRDGFRAVISGIDYTGRHGVIEAPL